MNKKTLTVAVVAVVAGLVSVGGFFYLNKSAVNAPSLGEATPGAGANLSEAPTNTPTGGLGGQVFGQVSANPVQGNIPETNPFTAEAVANPYSDSSKNPFSQ